VTYAKERKIAEAEETRKKLDYQIQLKGEERAVKPDWH